MLTMSLYCHDVFPSICQRLTRIIFRKTVSGNSKHVVEKEQDHRMYSQEDEPFTGDRTFWNGSILSNVYGNITGTNTFFQFAHLRSKINIEKQYVRYLI